MSDDLTIRLDGVALTLDILTRDAGAHQAAGIYRDHARAAREARDEITRLREGIERHRSSWRRPEIVGGDSLDVMDPHGFDRALWALLDAPSTDPELCPDCGDNGDCGETAVECGDEFHGNGRH